MLKDLLTNTIPQPLVESYQTLLASGLPCSHNWYVLQHLWNQFNPDSSVQFLSQETPSGPEWLISETLPSYSPSPLFSMSRSQLTFSRRTLADEFGLLGLSRLNTSDPRVILTEGVSDFFTASLLCPHSNVLGFTTLAGSSLSKVLLLSLFDQFIYCADSDSAGLATASRVRSLCQSFQKPVSIFTTPGFKDLSDCFISNLKFSNARL